MSDHFGSTVGPVNLRTRGPDRLVVDPAAALPVLQRGWLDTLTGISNPRSEQRSTCADCVMCADRGPSRVRFSPDVKCCSYVPHLANFLAGRSLAGPGRGSVLERVRRRAGTSPLGLGLALDDLHRMLDHRSAFGQDDVVRCPHFVPQTQGCGIWGSRNTVCSTWFCRHDRGAVGQGFWHAVRDLLLAIEERVADLCLTEGGLPTGQVEAVLEHRATVRAVVGRANAGEPVDALAWEESDDVHARLWDEWEGREEDWFARCAAIVDDLTDADLVGLVAGLDGGPALVDAVRARWADLGRRDLPERLHLTPGPGTEVTDDVLHLVGYSPFDPVVLPASLAPGLELLDGRPVADAVGLALDAHDVVLDLDVLGTLHDFGVVSPPPG